MANKIKGAGLIAGLAFSFFFVAGCEQAAEIEQFSAGEVSFDITSVIESDEITRSDDGVMTKTEYSGQDETGADVNRNSLYERINWLNTDMIKILCQQAQGDKDANFSITPLTTSANVSNASITPADHKLYWNPNGGDHYFFGLYPSPYMENNSTGADIATASNGTAAKISAKIPASQSVTYDATNNELKPDMAYAYMYAVQKATPGTDIHLSFKPLMNALRFTLKSTTAFPSGLTLKKLELSSTQTGSSLAGNFSATITENGFDPTSGLTVSGGSNTITINLPDGVQLSTTDPLMFTFFTLPMNQTAMKLTLTFSDNSTKVLNLKTGGSDITLHATKKAYINDVGLPWVYTLEVTPTITANYLGKTTTYTVTSYKKISNNSTTKYPVKWNAISYAVDGGTATSTKPAWLPTFKQSDTPSNGNPKDWDIKIAPADRNNPGIAALENEPEKGSEGSPWDLSTHDINGNSISKTTANCYVITGPGWYKFPLAYGNAYKGGSTNTDAYKHTLSSYNSHYLKNFKDANNNNISSADISGIDGVQLVWQDAQNLITTSDLKLSEDKKFIIFHVEKENIREGNAVIAARKGNTTFWSWHIWVTPYVKSNVTLKGKTYMARNLGWCEGGTTTWQPRTCVITFRQNENPSVTKTLTITQTGNTETVLGSSPHYQWGRKDPMIPPIGLSDATQYAANKIWYNASGTASQQVPIKKGPQTIGYGFQNPMTMIYDPRESLPRGTSGSGDSGSGHYYSDWIGNTDTWESNNHYCNLWNYNVNKNGTNLVGLNVVDYNGLAHGKTVYDPCPIGYTIPTPYELANLATFKTSNYLDGYTLYNNSPGTFTSSSTMVGYKINGNFWPANGMRMYLSNDTHVANVGTYGYWFSSGPFNSHMVLSLLEYTPGNPDGYTAGFSIDGGYAKASARSIRCVPE